MKQFFVILFAAICINLNAQQQITFTKAESSKTVIIKEKDLVRLSFKGYMNQQQVMEGYVSSVTDSSITLAPRKKLFQKIMGAQTIMLKDISGFKRFSKFRPAGEIIYGVAGVGLNGTIAAVASNANLTGAAGFAATAGTSIVTGVVKNLFLPKKIKYFLKDGWQMKLVNPAN
jgi:hypothetical protein